MGTLQLGDGPDLPTPNPSPEGEGLIESNVPAILQQAATKLLDVLSGDWPEREGAWTSAQSLARLRWPWAPLVLDRLKAPPKDERWLFSKLPEWEEAPVRPAPRTISLDERDVVDRLTKITGTGAETRTGQQDYARAAVSAFQPASSR